MAESRPPAFGIARPDVDTQDVTSERLLLGDEVGRGGTSTRPGHDAHERPLYGSSTDWAPSGARSGGSALRLQVGHLVRVEAFAGSLPCTMRRKARVGLSGVGMAPPVWMKPCSRGALRVHGRTHLPRCQGTISVQNASSEGAPDQPSWGGPDAGERLQHERRPCTRQRTREIG
jgi:hypothetical protein